MNTYFKYCPNVYLAKCDSPHQRGEEILVTTKYGKENSCLVWNEIFQRDGFYFYSITRVDGLNFQSWAKKRAERLEKQSERLNKKSDEYYEKSNKHKDFLSLAEPIKVGHHSEKRHRKIIKQSWDNMGKSVEFSEKAKKVERKISWYENKMQNINLSMPESLYYYEKLSKYKKEIHEGIKSGALEKSHSYSLAYANKDKKETEKKLQIARKLWAIL